MLKELRNKAVEELKVLKKDLSAELFKLRLQHSTGQLEKSHRLEVTKREIARVLTVLKEKTVKA